MERASVTSSNLVSIGYDSDQATLEVEFKGGAVYQYFGVPQQEYDALMAAGSHGTYLGSNIKGRYSFVKL